MAVQGTIINTSRDISANISRGGTTLSASINAKQRLQKLFLIDENKNYIVDENGGRILVGEELIPIIRGITAVIH